MINKRTSMNRKVYKRDINKLISNVNKSIQNDWLWAGRFYIHQKAAYFYTFEDHSGGLYHVVLEMVDRKTGRTTEKIFDNYNILRLLPEWIDEVICQIFKVWEEDPNPNQQARAAGRIPD